MLTHAVRITAATATSPKFDRLQLTPQALALEQTRGHDAVHDAPHPHWKYFWFD